MAEKNFADKLIGNIDLIKDMKFERGKGLCKDLIKESEEAYESNIQSNLDETYIVDSIFVKGVSHIREENDCNYGNWRKEPAQAS